LRFAGALRFGEASLAGASVVVALGAARLVRRGFGRVAGATVGPRLDRGYIAPSRR